MIKRSCLFVLVSALLLVGAADAQYPILDMLAQRVIEKYEQSTCEQLWKEGPAEIAARTGGDSDAA